MNLGESTKEARLRGRWWLLVLAVLAAALSIAAAGCGGDEAAAPPPAPPPAEPAPPPAEEPAPAPAEEPAPAPAEEPAPAAAECADPSGTVTAFGTVDAAGVAGDIGPGMVRAYEVELPILNAAGGFGGCQLALDIIDEPFPDVDQCLGNWRTALSEGDKYPFYFGAFNSACMAAVPDLTNAVSKVIVANSAADHQPFFDPKFKKYNVHGAVSTFLEGRASATFAAEKGWKRIAMIVPNYAYGQDAGKAFKEYFLQLVPDGEIVNEQFPEFAEENFTPFINAIVAAEPDAIFSAFFGPFVVPFYKQWKDSGNDATIPVIGGLTDTPTFELITSADEIPANMYGYARGNWQLLSQTASGKAFFDAYVAAYGGTDHPVPSGWAFAWVSGLQMAKALADKTGGFDPDAWIAAIEAGDFTFESVYSDGPTGVNPVNHMADTCAQVGLVTWDDSLPVPASYDPNDFQNYCMHDILPMEEAARITTNPNATPEAIAAYQAVSGTP